MKINTESIYIVMQPYPGIEDFEELFVDAERNLADLEDLFSGGIKAKDIFGLYTDKKSALKDALKLWKEVTKEKTPIDDNKKERFREFVTGLEKLSNTHNIAIAAVGGVYIFDEPQIITYDEDHTSGDLVAYWDNQN
ncbi:hypothetical protein FOF46_28175 [Aquimarina algiphila]|uniref:Uncharacterized protein n=3 Tax=Aquimarina algiphila TaxID=2047982 RepID=A0A554VBK9_9FLAO|nr:hypothetical protein [Aquimarina algiphila]TSE03944.1 hypothetical protein FOF46_28175 [Aquimarina algiphila]